MKCHYAAHWLLPREALAVLWEIQPASAGQFSYVPQSVRPDAEYYETFHVFRPDTGSGRPRFRKVVPVSRIDDFVVKHLSTRFVSNYHLYMVPSPADLAKLNA